MLFGIKFYTILDQSDCVRLNNHQNNYTKSKYLNIPHSFNASTN